MLAIKITRKQEYEGTAEQVLYRYISYYDPSLVGLHILQDGFLYICSKIYMKKCGPRISIARMRFPLDGELDFYLKNYDFYLLRK